MAWYLRWLGAGLALGMFWLAVAAAPARATGYLRVVGPAPLRFLKPTASPGPAARLPPVRPENPSTNLEAQVTNVIGSDTHSLTNMPFAPAATTGATAGPQIESPALAAGEPPKPSLPAETGTIETQWVRRYLTPTWTNPPTGGGIMPQFVPPVTPERARSSQAIYEVQ